MEPVEVMAEIKEAGLGILVLGLVFALGFVAGCYWGCP